MYGTYVKDLVRAASGPTAANNSSRVSTYFQFFARRSVNFSGTSYLAGQVRHRWFIENITEDVSVSTGRIGGVATYRQNNKFQFPWGYLRPPIPPGIITSPRAKFHFEFYVL